MRAGIVSSVNQGAIKVYGVPRALMDLPTLLQRDDGCLVESLMSEWGAGNGELPGLGLMKPWESCQ